MAMDATISPARSKNGGSAKKLIKDQLSLVETKGSNGETKVEVSRAGRRKPGSSHAAVGAS